MRNYWVMGALVLALFAACGESSDKKTQRGSGDTQETVTEVPENPPPTLPREPEKEPEAPAPDTTPTAPTATYDLEWSLRLNQVQLKGTHNSYHVRPEFDSDPAWEYDMPPLSQQASDFGVRAFELDVHWIDGDFHVFHWPVDPGTKCPLLADCLRDLKGWSQANPGHAPIFIFIDLKYDGAGDSVFNHLDLLDWMLTEAWPREKAYTPDDLVGGYADVHAALRDKGWPTLGEVRGKAIFVLMASEPVSKRYAHDDRGLQGRRMFVSTGDTGWRHGGFIIYDDLPKMLPFVTGAVRSGFMVRTRADDIPTIEQTISYQERLQMALNSGAQLVMTDYPVPQAVAGYEMTIPGGTPLRCNPVTGTAECTSLQIENPELLTVSPGGE